jgi:hypothetical protein
MFTAIGFFEFPEIQTGSEAYGGTVFYVDNTNRHGLVVGPYDLGNWGSSAYNTPSYQLQIVNSALGTYVYSSIGGGKIITDILIEDDNSSWIGDLATYNATSSYSDFYLPNKTELANLMGYWINGGTIPNMALNLGDSPYYRSVEEVQSNQLQKCWDWNGDANSIQQGDKLNTLPFRPIREF